MRPANNYVRVCFSRIKKKKSKKSPGFARVRKCSDGSTATDCFFAMRKVFPSQNTCQKIMRDVRHTGYERTLIPISAEHWGASRKNEAKNWKKEKRPTS